ncbi:MAG TPA: hypothetical protein HPP77_11355 [Candidatus Hydrogenedentes bacterium]|nr:hypothetical protein [Candidatus Hydrogenedentota bacterium]HIJ72546.1 hypothetical protein [Candidatus Hydrogenedentota bacterium]
MKRPASNLIFSLVVVGVLCLGAFQGRRVADLRESDAFYRWILTAAKLAPLGELEDLTPEPNAPDMKDDELFEAVVAVTENLLPEPAATDEDRDGEGGLYPKLVRHVYNDDQAADVLIWKLASGDSLEAARKEFLDYRGKGQLFSLGTQFDPAAMYASKEGSPVSLSNLFLGFRIMAANLVWLKVDQFYHQGMLHRMLPLMDVCVRLDPHFVDAYKVGAWYLAYNITAHMLGTPEPLKWWDEKHSAWVGEKEEYYYRGVDFLLDGIRKNPRDSSLYFDLGYMIYFIKLRDYANAARYLGNALQYEHEIFVRRMYNHALMRSGQYEKSLAGWQDYLEKFPEAKTADVARRYIEINQGLIFERDAEEAKARALTLDGEEGKAAEEEAERLYQEATRVWEKLRDEEQEPYAIARFNRAKALKYWEQKRYHEAVAILDMARYDSNDFWDEASNMIIAIKQEADMPLTLSEKLAVKRQEEAEAARKLRQQKSQE